MKLLPVLVLGVVVFTAGLLVFSGARSAHGAAVSKSTFGPGAAGSWQLPGRDGSFTFVTVSAGQGTFHLAGQVPGHGSPSSQNTVGVLVFQVFPGDPNDPNDDRFHIIFGEADLSKGQPAIQRGFSRADLSVTVDGTDCSTELPCFDTTITINLSWAATAKTRTDNFQLRGVSDGCRFNGQFHGTFRPATATGTVEAGGIDYTGGAPGDGQIVSNSQNTNVTTSDCFGPSPTPTPTSSPPA